MKVTEFTIKRSQWLHGEGSPGSFLLRTRDQKMCCLGFFCLAAGCNEGDIALVQVPNELQGECKANIAEQLLDPAESVHTDTANNLMTINDRHLGCIVEDVIITTEEEREQMITDLFKQMGVKVNFVD